MDKLSKEEMIALFRYGIIADLLSVPKKGSILKKEITELSQKTWLNPFGHLTKFSFSAIEEWYYSYIKFGFSGLEPKKRKDKGVCRALPTTIQDEIIKRKKANPELKTAQIIRQLIEENIISYGKSSISTIYRFISSSGLKNLSIKEPKERRAFEVLFPGELWQSDIMYGPYLIQDKRKKRTYLYSFIDDSSRIIPHAQFYFSESLASLVDCFKQAVIKRGIPYKLYTDNGKVYLSHFFNIICANLGVKLLHCQPFDPSAKGKIERFFRTLRDQFISLLDIPKIKNIDELNANLINWIESKYHTQFHSSLESTPLEKWLINSKNIRVVYDPKSIEPLFLTHSIRRVSRDGCVSLMGKRFEVDISFVGKKVELRYDPFLLDKILVYFNNEFIQQALPLDTKLNAYLPRKRNTKGDA